MANEIRKGMCVGCPWDYGKQATEDACNLGCLPAPGEAAQAAHKNDKAWACHDDFSKMCCGYAAEYKHNHDRDLHTVDDGW